MKENAPSALWLDRPAMLVAFARIANERTRQRELFRAGKLWLAMDSQVVSDDRKLRVVVEEIGEIAQEIDLLEQVTKGRTESTAAFQKRYQALRADLREEITQAAAVLVAWLESFESTINSQPSTK